MPSRRAVLATAGSLLAAGCLAGPGDPGTSDDPDDERSPTDYTHTGEPRGTDGCSGGYHVSAEPFDPAEELLLRLGDRERSLVAEAVETGAAEATLYADTPPVDDGVYARHDGAYYETTATEVDSTEVPALVTNLEWERGQQAPDGADVVPFDDLPSADREALRYGVYGGPYEREQRGHPRESLSLHEVPLPYPDGTDDSVLAGDGETWVRWDDRTYRVWTEGESTMTRHRFRLRVTEVAGDADAFRAHVADRYLLELTGLSDDERAVLREAIGGTYEECEPASDGLAALRERLPADAELPPPVYDDWYVAYEGDRYRLEVSRWVH